jgi:hypothetical protein
MCTGGKLIWGKLQSLEAKARAKEERFPVGKIYVLGGKISAQGERFRQRGKAQLNELHR